MEDDFTERLLNLALRLGINTNVIRDWLPIYSDQTEALLPAFIPLQTMPRRHAEETVVIALNWVLKPSLSNGPSLTVTALDQNLVQKRAVINAFPIGNLNILGQDTVPLILRIYSGHGRSNNTHRVLFNAARRCLS